uniref:carbonic anhydrase n=1 Tax=Chromera velia CCMP2878 TaxID=1169474 RepID=A0A0G4HGL5_9ALVE|mmetsp:Transcript_8821/g.17218  ORF Transcript_8821/g.17218 Transcript_8821/m.17218 type:complete len:539 (-) Transcript_8821:209-1825(-)|eukprot:Cvel_27284.t1-p1 / transcript=Cvel_27284.t1 / gene=Cvel_27284 / organism=Chromera_velia_CCMP2878 / gene_product=Carbonic anhydrase 2, putative / transcript_product=Carbonic anhydrase 2, putative / location=Cvel_scaffold3380:13519-15132(-) / protein_length=538 / sequence_SO=supercontig / SO=protein_coding / is_pseudo=false
MVAFLSLCLFLLALEPSRLLSLALPEDIRRGGGAHSTAGALSPTALLSSHTETRESEQGKNLEWTYDQHGADWPGLCQSTTRQSPVALPAVSSPPSNSETAVFFNYPDITSACQVRNTGHGLVVDVPEKRLWSGGIRLGTRGDTVPDESTEAPLRFMRLYAPSQHTWNGKHADLELHLIHHVVSDECETGASGADCILQLAFGFHGTQNKSEVIARLIDDGLPDLPTNEGDNPPVLLRNIAHNQAINFRSLLSEVGLIDYEGSMMRPPCTENVRMFVADRPLEASIWQVQKVVDALQRITTGQGNNRLVQPLGDRTLSLVETVDISPKPAEVPGEETGEPGLIAAAGGNSVVERGASVLVEAEDGPSPLPLSPSSAPEEGGDWLPSPSAAPLSAVETEVRSWRRRVDRQRRDVREAWRAVRAARAAADRAYAANDPSWHSLLRSVASAEKRLDGEKGILEWSEKSLSSALSRAQAERDGEGESVGDGQASQHTTDTAPSTDSSGSDSEAGDPDVDSYGRGVVDEGRLPVEGSARKEYS